MISIIVALIIIALALWTLISSIKNSETGVGIVVAIIILAFGTLFGIIVPTSVIEGSDNVHAVQWSEKHTFDEVKVYEDVYVFKDGDTELAFPSNRVVVLNPEETPGYRLGTEYRSWGNWWVGKDWPERDLLQYTPSNKG